MLIRLQISPPSALAPIGSAHVFVTSITGDSQLVKLGLAGSSAGATATSSRTSPKAIARKKGKNRASAEAAESGWNVALSEEKGSASVLERWVNLAPVKDFATVGDESGAVVSPHRVIRVTVDVRLKESVAPCSGVRLIDIKLTTHHSQWCWSRRHVVDRGHRRSAEHLANNARRRARAVNFQAIGCADLRRSTKLLLSTNASSHLLDISPSVSVSGLCSQIASRPTLAAALLPDSRLLATISSHGAEVWGDVVNGERIAAWNCPQGKEVVAADMADGVMVLALRGGQVVVLSANGTELQHEAYVPRFRQDRG